MEVLKRLKKFFSRNENNEIFSREVYQKNFEMQLVKDSKLEGKIEGENNKALEITKNLLSENMDENAISRITGLSINEINKLKMEM